MTDTGKVFEWDERKRCSNLLKHGLDFADCAAVFGRPALTWVDDRYDYGETRYVTLGVLQGKVVSLVHTVEGDFIRVISLRRANRREQAQYFQAFQD
jgi:uncharacterized DUF497 family protein